MHLSRVIDTMCNTAFTVAFELDQSGPLGGNACMQITRATDYATRVMIYLATLPPGVKAQRVAMAKAADVPESFLSKLLQRLVSAGLVQSARGSGGGYELAEPRRRVSLLDILEAMEGETQLNACLADGPSCNRKSWCPAHPVWLQAQKALTDVLRRTSVSKLAREAVAPPRFQRPPRGTANWPCPVERPRGVDGIHLDHHHRQSLHGNWSGTGFCIRGEEGLFPQSGRRQVSGFLVRR